MIYTHKRITYLDGLTQGVYFINITDENGVKIKNDKLIIMTGQQSQQLREDD